jgi:hypothetical protein
MDLSIPASGMNDARLRFNAAAQNIANLNTPPPIDEQEVITTPAPNGGGVQSRLGSQESVFSMDLASNLIYLKQAEFSYLSNAMAFQKATEVVGSIIDIFDNQHDAT